MDVGDQNPVPHGSPSPTAAINTTAPAESGETVPSSPKEETGFYQPYADFARNLRTWFVAYGVGAPVLFATQDSLLNALIRSGWGRTVAAIFLIGVAIQVGVTIMYKAAMWHLYVAELDPANNKGRGYRVSEWLSESFAFEVAIDLITLTLFVAGTVLALVVMVPVAPAP